jgi:hypothetical protein
MSTYVEMADVLEQAADLIETVGWAQGREIKSQPPTPNSGRPLILRRDGLGDQVSLEVVGYCARGAIRAAAGRSLVIRAQITLASWLVRNNLLGFRHDSNPSSIPYWNDRSGRTAAEVIDAMKSCAKDLRNEAVPS